jgi:hypothetical protein
MIIKQLKCAIISDKQSIMVNKFLFFLALKSPGNTQKNSPVLHDEKSGYFIFEIYLSGLPT